MVHKWRIFLSVFEETDVRKDAGLIMARRRENSWSYLSSLVKKKKERKWCQNAPCHNQLQCDSFFYTVCVYIYILYKKNIDSYHLNSKMTCIINFSLLLVFHDEICDPGPQNQFIFLKVRFIHQRKPE